MISPGPGSPLFCALCAPPYGYDSQYIVAVGSCQLYVVVAWSYKSLIGGEEKVH